MTLQPHRVKSSRPESHCLPVLHTCKIGCAQISFASACETDAGRQGTIKSRVSSAQRFGSLKQSSLRVPSSCEREVLARRVSAVGNQHERRPARGLAGSRPGHWSAANGYFCSAPCAPRRLGMERSSSPCTGASRRRATCGSHSARPKTLEAHPDW